MSKYFCLAVKYPNQEEFTLDDCALRKDFESLRVQKEMLEKEQHLKDAQVKIFQFQLIDYMD